MKMLEHWNKGADWNIVLVSPRVAIDSPSYAVSLRIVLEY
jgi:hypothetical protein